MEIYIKNIEKINIYKIRIKKITKKVVKYFMEINEKTVKKSISFEVFLKNKFESPSIRYETPVKNEGKTDSPIKFVDSLKKMKKFIDSGFKKNSSPEKVLIPESYLQSKENIEEKIVKFQEENEGISTKNHENLTENNDSLRENKEKMQENRKKSLEINEQSQDNSHFSSFVNENPENQLNLENNEENIEQPFVHYKKPTIFSNLYIKTKANDDNYEINHEIPLDISKNYNNLKDKMNEFDDFLNSLGWKSKSYLKEQGGKSLFSNKFMLKYEEKKQYIRELNSKISSFEEKDFFFNEYPKKNMRNMNKKFI